ncbi:UNVERIFIED_CONTAM: hypothetical protein HDU68_000286 [Siphonaria sp. JEL0065]|nr:hypothetical protein HDU68_000286 [Siphonaria sp. JEL0065]
MSAHPLLNLQALSPTKESAFESAEQYDPSQPRLFGLPKTSTTTFASSHLTTESTHDENDEEDEDDGHESDTESECSSDQNHNDLPLPKQPSKDTADKSTDIYLLIHRLQTDISQHQALIDKHMKHEQEYQAFREAYESKLHLLQSQIQNVGRERDEALKKCKTTGSKSGGGERPGTAAIKQRYDDQRRKLEQEILEYKRKMREKEKENGRSKSSEGLTKQLMQTIESLKVEKFKALKELKKESTKIREVKTTKEREIARLKKKEKAATELAKRLERSNQLQKIAIKRRSDDYAKSQATLKTLKAAMLKQNASILSATTEEPAQQQSMSLRSSKRLKRGSKTINNNALKDDEALRRALRIGMSVGNISGVKTANGDGPPMEIRSKFKKQMIDKELGTTGDFSIAELELSVMKSARDRLIGEQRELLAERERCVAADAEMAGVWDIQKPQYMDDRLGVIDMEVAVLNARIRSMQEEIKLGKAAASLSSAANDEEEVSLSFETSVTEGDLGWDNAVNLLRSLDSIEMEYVAVLLLQDIVDHKITVKSMETKIIDYEKNVMDLRASLATMRGAALQTAVDYRKEMENIKQIAQEKINAIVSEVQQRPKSLARSKSSLFSYDEFGAATPKLQRMFDSAYGHGFVVLKPSSQRRLNSVEFVTDTETIARGVESALRKQQQEEEGGRQPDVEGDVQTEEEEDVDMDLDSDSPLSPVLRMSTNLRYPAADVPQTPVGDFAWIPPPISKVAAVSPPRKYNLRSRSRRVSTDKENEDIVPNAPLVVSEFENHELMQPVLLAEPAITEVPPRAVHDLRPPPSIQPTTSSRGRADFRSFQSPVKPARASSVPVSSPIDPDSNKFIVKSFIKKQKSKAARNALVTMTLQDLEAEEELEASTAANTSFASSTTQARNESPSACTLIAADTSMNLVRKRVSKVSGLIAASENSTLEAGSDVFSRLAMSHTLASQAKVIHRDKDGVAVGGSGAVVLADVFGSNAGAPRKMSLVEGKAAD